MIDPQWLIWFGLFKRNCPWPFVRVTIIMFFTSVPQELIDIFWSTLIPNITNNSGTFLLPMPMHFRLVPMLLSGTTCGKPNFFLWKCGHSAIPARTFFRGRHLILEDLCPWCSSAPEEISHLLRDRVISHDFWESLSAKIYCRPRLHPSWTDF